jgi:hypothetical protein
LPALSSREKRPFWTSTWKSCSLEVSLKIFIFPQIVPHRTVTTGQPPLGMYHLGKKAFKMHTHILKPNTLLVVWNKMNMKRQTLSKYFRNG